LKASAGQRYGGSPANAGGSTRDKSSFHLNYAIRC
jgi:hypothetical protein